MVDTRFSSGRSGIGERNRRIDIDGANYRRFGIVRDLIERDVVGGLGKRRRGIEGYIASLRRRGILYNLGVEVVGETGERPSVECRLVQDREVGQCPSGVEGGGFVHSRAGG